MVYEANARIQDPVYGCAGAIVRLQQQVLELQRQLALSQAAHCLTSAAHFTYLRPRPPHHHLNSMTHYNSAHTYATCTTDSTSTSTAAATSSLLHDEHRLLLPAVHEHPCALSTTFMRSPPNTSSTSILNEEERAVIICFGHDWDETCMQMDEVLASIAEMIKNFVVIYLVDITEVKDFSTMYELYDPCIVMFFFCCDKHIMTDLETRNNNKVNWALKDKQEFIGIIETVYKGVRKGRGLVISPKDYYTKILRLLGHVILKGGSFIDPDKIAAIMEAVASTNAKQCAIFMGQARWHGRHLLFVAHLAIPINYVAHAKVFEWTLECDLAYRNLKSQLSKVPIMILPIWDRDFHVFVDALDKAIGSVLMQKQTYGWFWPVYYASRRLSSVEKNYFVTKRECLGMIYSMKKFWHYLLGSRFFFHVDHSALLYLARQQNLTGRLARWVLLLQEFEFEVIHHPGAQHAVVDYLACLDSGEPSTRIADEFPDASLFLTRVVADEARLEQSARKIPSIPWTWYEEMFHFLDSGDMLELLSCHQ
ncbi:hypothetical protein L7F22_005829 [Adiantum nelumboides]|nr:hypothetical protein [Adiantum nelumboides]